MQGSDRKIDLKSYIRSQTPRGAAQGIINQYGWKRVECVLANTIVHRAASGHFSANNEKWAKGIIPLDNEDKVGLLIHVPLAYLEIFTNQARRYQHKRQQEQNEEKQQLASKAVEREKQVRNADTIAIDLNNLLPVNSVEKTCHTDTIKDDNLEKVMQYTTLQAQKVPCETKIDKKDGRISIKEKLTKRKETTSLQKRKMPEVSKKREKEEMLEN